MKEYVDVEVLKQQDFQDFSNTDVMHAINNCPRVDVMPVKHAHWIENENDSITCSACGHTTNEVIEEVIADGVYKVLNPYFCANCGTKMDEEVK